MSDIDDAGAMERARDAATDRYLDEEDDDEEAERIEAEGFWAEQDMEDDA